MAVSYTAPQIEAFSTEVGRIGQVFSTVPCLRHSQIWQPTQHIAGVAWRHLTFMASFHGILFSARKSLSDAVHIVLGSPPLELNNTLNYLSVVGKTSLTIAFDECMQEHRHYATEIVSCCSSHTFVSSGENYDTTSVQWIEDSSYVKIAQRPGPKKCDAPLPEI